MITVRVKITGYDKERSVCAAHLLNGDIIEIDPFAGCAIDMTDDDYQKGKGFEIIGNSYLLIEYWVSKDGVVPYEGGMIRV